MTPWKRGDVWVLEWSVRLHDGKLLTKKRSQGATKGEARARARRSAERLLTTSADSTWSAGDPIVDYIVTDAIPRIETAKGLQAASIERYLAVARLLAGQCEREDHEHGETLRGYSIHDACRTKRLSAVLQDIAETHGSETAHQARTVLGRYIVDPLADIEEIIPANPIRGRRLDLRGKHRGNGGPRDTGKALTREQYWKVVDFLLQRGDDPAIDPDRPDEERAPRRGAHHTRHTPEKWKAARDQILLQAGTGLRAGEATTLRWDEVQDDGHAMVVPVSPDRSKTKSARRAAVVDEIAAHLRQRRESRPDDVYVIPAPADGAKTCERRGRDGATAALYMEMAHVLDIPLLRRDFRGHGWRTTLNSLTADTVPVEVRSALLGHTEKVNREHYLDQSDLTAVARAMNRKPDLRAV